MLNPKIHEKEQVLLHVGCGRKDKSRTTAGFRASHWREIRLDIDPSVQPDVVGSMTDMSCLTDQSVDAIFSSHNIEHLYPHEAPLALAEFHRVLKEDGFLVLTCPDLMSVCRRVVDGKLTQPAYQSPAGPITPLDILFGHQRSLSRGNLYMAHRSGYTELSLREMLSATGFSAIATLTLPRKFELWCVAAKANLSQQDMTLLATSHLPTSATMADLSA